MKRLAKLVAPLIVGAFGLALSGCALGVPGGDGVGNGGVIAEKNFIFAYHQLENELKSCLESIDCRLKPEDEKIIRAIHTALVNGTENLHGVEFRSSKDSPGLFVMDGKPRAARTGKNPGDKIYVNIDQLYRTEGGLLRPISVRECTGLLIHELAHHYGIGSSEAEMARLHEMSASVLSFLEASPTRANDGTTSTRETTTVAPVLECRSLRLNGTAAAFSVYFVRTTEGVSYQGAWSMVTRELPKDRFDLRVKHSADTVQVLPSLDSTESFDLRLSRSTLAGNPTPLVPKYDARMTIDGSVETWQCTIPRDSVTKLSDPLWVLFVR